MPPDTTDEWTPERIREDRIASRFSSALLDIQEAAGILAKGYPHFGSERKKLVTAAESLNAYLAELER